MTPTYLHLLCGFMVTLNDVCKTCKYQCHFCGSCVHWIHNKCNGVKGTMCPCPDFNCASWFGLASPMDGTDKMEVEYL